MSVREMYSDRDPDRTSSEIILNTSANSLNNTIELEYLRKYKTIYALYLESKLSNNLSNITNLKAELAKLETSNPIQSILIREKHPCENIKMEFGKMDNFLQLYTDAKCKTEDDKYTLSDEDSLLLMQYIKNMHNGNFD